MGLHVRLHALLAFTAVVPLAYFSSCKPQSLSSVKDEEAPSGPATGAAGSAGDCPTTAAANTEGTDAPPDFTTMKDKQPDCPEGVLDGPAWAGGLTAGTSYVASASPTPGTNSGNGLGNNNNQDATALRLDDPNTPPADPNANSPTTPPDPNAQANNGSGSGSGTGTGTGTGATGDATTGEACDSRVTDVKKLYGPNAGALKACTDEGFGDDLNAKFQAVAGQAIPAKADSAAPGPKTRAEYEKRTMDLLTSILEKEKGSSLALDVSATAIDLPTSDVTTTAEHLEEDPTSVVQPETPLDPTDVVATVPPVTDFPTNLDAVATADDTGSTGTNALALADAAVPPLGASNPAGGGGTRFWRLGNDNFGLSFSTKFGGKIGSDFAAGRNLADTDLQFRANDSDALLPGFDGPVTPDSLNPTKVKDFRGVSVAGDVRAIAKIFAHDFTAARAYIQGAAFSNTEAKNVIEVGFEVIGIKVWSKQWGKCSKPPEGSTAKAGCEERPTSSTDNLNRFQQRLAWLGRTARGRYNFTVGPVPMDAEWTFAPYIGYAWNIGVEMDPGAAKAGIYAAFQPQAQAAISLAGGFSFLGQRAGVGGRLIVLNISPVGKVGIEASLSGTTPKLCPYVRGDLNYSFLSGSLFAYAQVFYFIGSKYWEIQLTSWRGNTGTWNMLLVTPDSCGAAPGLLQAAPG